MVAENNNIDIPEGRIVIHYNESGFIKYIDWFETDTEEPLRYYPAVVSNRIDALIHLVEEQENITIGDVCSCDIGYEELPDE